MSARASTRALRVLLIAAMLFPLLTMRAVLALDTQQALRVVIVGVGVMALLAAWATSRQPVQPGRDDDLCADGRSAATGPRPITEEESGSCTQTNWPPTGSDSGHSSSTTDRCSREDPDRPPSRPVPHLAAHHVV